MTMTQGCEILEGGAPLLEQVRKEAAGATRVRFALGYLFLEGIAPVWPALDGIHGEVHLLIGNTAGTPTDEQRVAGERATHPGALVAAEMDVAAAARAERDQVLAETAAALRANLAAIPHADQNARLLVDLALGITENRVRVRIYADGRLHAKAYLFERPGGAVALVGSTNISLPSPGNPTELNVAVREPAAVTAVTTWFARLWDASHDFSRDLFAEISRAWPLGGTE